MGSHHGGGFLSSAKCSIRVKQESAPLELCDCFLDSIHCRNVCCNTTAREGGGGVGIGGCRVCDCTGNDGSGGEIGYVSSVRIVNPKPLSEHQTLVRKGV
jgi:hypothetical protein